MNVVAAAFLTVVLALLPVHPTYGTTGGAEPSASSPEPPVPAASPPAPAAPRPVPPVGDAHHPPAVARGFDPPHAPWGAGHRGVDLHTATGAQVRSPVSGTVTFAGQVAGRGVVVVTHADGMRSSLEPVAATVPVGTTVTGGEQIATVESSPSGHCRPASCLHWGVRDGERYVDPLSLLRWEPAPIVLLPDR